MTTCCLRPIKHLAFFVDHLPKLYLFIQRKFFILLETLQRRTTKFILNDCKSCYRSRLLTLRMLPLMMQLEIIHMLFFVTSIKHPTERFDILKYVTFPSESKRSSSKCTLAHTLSRKNRERHFYFHRLPCLWNSLPSIDLNQSVRSIKQQLKLFFWKHFVLHFNPDIPCTFHFVCPCNRCVALPISCNFHDDIL